MGTLQTFTPSGFASVGLLSEVQSSVPSLVAIPFYYPAATVAVCCAESGGFGGKTVAGAPRQPLLLLIFPKC